MPGNDGYSWQSVLTTAKTVAALERPLGRLGAALLVPAALALYSVPLGFVALIPFGSLGLWLFVRSSKTSVSPKP